MTRRGVSPTRATGAGTIEQNEVPSGAPCGGGGSSLGPSSLSNSVRRRAQVCCHQVGQDRTDSLDYHQE
jgi:hypothetical protein